MLFHGDIYEEFMARCLVRIAAIVQGDPLDTETIMGPQVSKAQIDKIASYVEIGKNEGAQVLIGGNRATVDDEFTGGYFFEPTVLKGDNKMRVFQEEIFGPVLSVTTFKFVVGDIDLLLGDIDGSPFYIDKRLDEAWHQDQFLLDVAAGEPEGFSLTAGDNQRFVTLSPACATTDPPERSRPDGRTATKPVRRRFSLPRSPAPTRDSPAG